MGKLINELFLFIKSLGIFEFYFLYFMLIIKLGNSFCVVGFSLNMVNIFDIMLEMFGKFVDGLKLLLIFVKIFVSGLLRISLVFKRFCMYRFEVVEVFNFVVFEKNLVFLWLILFFIFF